MPIKRELNELFVTPVIKISFDQNFPWKHNADLVYNTLTEERISSIYKIGVTPTDDDLHKRKEFFDLYKLIDDEARKFFNLELGLDNEDVYMSCMWANVQIDGCRHHVHCHPNAFYSGVIYLEIPDGPDVEPGFLFFVDPRPAKLMQVGNFKKHNWLSDRSYGFKPQLGAMLLFPSWLNHGTDIASMGAGKRRISVSFNYVLTKCSEETMTMDHRPTSI